MIKAMDDNQILTNVVFSVRDPVPEHIKKAITHKYLSSEEEGEYISSDNHSEYDDDDDNQLMLNMNNDDLNKIIIDGEVENPLTVSYNNNNNISDEEENLIEVLSSSFSSLNYDNNMSSNNNNSNNSVSSSNSNDNNNISNNNKNFKNQENEKSNKDVDKFNKIDTTTIKDRNEKVSRIILNEENNNNNGNVDEAFIITKIKELTTLKKNLFQKLHGEHFQSQIFIGNKRSKEQSSPSFGPSFNKRSRTLSASTSNGISNSNSGNMMMGRARDDQYPYYHRNDYRP
ncbi:14950_t:CDS:2, partial [Entrophospora sp. SA101]